MYRDRKGKFHKKPADRTSKLRKSAYGVYLTNKKVLLVKPKWSNLWEFPGGGKNPNEKIGDTLRREFVEETGFTKIIFDENPLKILRTKFYADDLDIYFESEMYFFRINKLSSQNKGLVNRNEISDLGLISIKKLNKDNMKNTHLKILSNYLTKNFTI